MSQFHYQIHGVVSEVGECVIIRRPSPRGILKESQLGVDCANLHQFCSSTAAILFGGYFSLVETINKMPLLGIHSRIWSSFYRKPFGFINIHAASSPPFFSSHSQFKTSEIGTLCRCSRAGRFLHQIISLRIINRKYYLSNGGMSVCRLRFKTVI